VRPLQPARAVVLVLWLARTFADDITVHSIRRRSLSIFSIFYGLDWVATGPATFALTNELFGRRDTPVIISWIFAGHQVGGALAAFGAGAVRSMSGDYLLAFLTSGLACLLASLLVLRVARPESAIVPAV